MSFGDSGSDGSVNMNEVSEDESTHSDHDNLLINNKDPVTDKQSKANSKKKEKKKKSKDENQLFDSVRNMGNSASKDFNHSTSHPSVNTADRTGNFGKPDKSNYTEINNSTT